MVSQTDLFEGVKFEVPEPRTLVKLGSKSALIPIRRQRREAIAKLLPVLKELEGKDIFISSYHPGGSHFWFQDLKLQRLKLEYYPYRETSFSPTVIVLWGCRGGHVRIFPEYLVAVREQEYEDYWHWLLDFRNGFWQSPVDNYRSHYACLHITRFKR